MDSPIRTGTPLRQRMIDDMRMRELEHKTQEAYIRAVCKLVAFLRRSPDTATVEDLRRFQLHLVDQGTSPITLNATLTGLKFFFDVTLDRGELMAKMQPVRVPRTLPVVLSREQVARLIAAAPNLKSRERTVSGLRYRIACQRGDCAEGRRHRQPTHDLACGARQGPQRSLRHALTSAARTPARMVARGPCSGQDPT